MNGAQTSLRAADRQQLEFVHETLAAAQVHLSHALDLIELGQAGPSLDYAVRCFLANTKAGVSSFAEFRKGREQG